MMNRFVFLLVALTLAACAPRARLVMAPAEVTRGETQTVFVSSSRKALSVLNLTEKRSSGLVYMRYDISVPPKRALGEISWPTGTVDPETQFIVTRADDLGGTKGFRAGLAGALRAKAPDDREVIIYVHGFNNTFADGVLRITQMAHDFKMPGVAVHYSWPSAGHPLAYAYDRDSVLFARDGLESLIQQVQAAGARRVVLVAHSVGSQLVMEVLRSMAIAQPGTVDDQIAGVILISPDVDIDVFRSQARRIGELPDPFGIFVSRRDKVLLLSAQLTGQRNRLGNVKNVDDVADLDVTIVDVSEFSSGAGHFVAGSSAAVISIFARPGALASAFAGDRSGRVGLLPATVLTVQNATEIILYPATGLLQ